LFANIGAKVFIKVYLALVPVTTFPFYVTTSFENRLADLKLGNFYNSCQGDNSISLI
jgi:hypothetical protein